MLLDIYQLVPLGCQVDFNMTSHSVVLRVVDAEGRDVVTSNFFVCDDITIDQAAAALHEGLCNTLRVLEQMNSKTYATGKG